jgi:hypothetical protein
MIRNSLLKGRYGGREEERRKKIFFRNGIVGNIFRPFPVDLRYLWGYRMRYLCVLKKVFLEDV